MLGIQTLFAVGSLNPENTQARPPTSTPAIANAALKARKNDSVAWGSLFQNISHPNGCRSGVILGESTSGKSLVRANKSEFTKRSRTLRSRQESESLRVLLDREMKFRWCHLFFLMLEYRRFHRRAIVAFDARTWRNGVIKPEGILQRCSQVETKFSS